MRGRWPSRPSLARLSCDRQITGTFSSRATALMPRRDLADLLLAALGAGVVHELHVVDHDALDVVLQLQPPGLGAQVERRQARRVVHPDRRLGQLADDVGQLRVLVRSGASPCGACARRSARGCRACAGRAAACSFPARTPRTAACVSAAMCSMMFIAKAVLPMRRPGRDDDHLAVLQAVHHVVELEEAGLEAALAAVLDHLEDFVQHVLHRRPSALPTFFWAMSKIRFSALSSTSSACSCGA